MFSQYIDAVFIQRMRLRAVIENGLELDARGEPGDDGGRAPHDESTMDDSVLIEFDERSNAKRFALGAKAKAVW